MWGGVVVCPSPAPAVTPAPPEAGLHLVPPACPSHPDLSATAAPGHGDLMAPLFGYNTSLRGGKGCEGRAHHGCLRKACLMQLGRGRGRGRRREKGREEGKGSERSSSGGRGLRNGGVACTTGAWPAQRGRRRAGPRRGRVPARPAPSARPTITPPAPLSPPLPRVAIGGGGGAGRGVIYGYRL